MCILHIDHYNCACDLFGEHLAPCALKTQNPLRSCQTSRLVHRLPQECPHCVWLAELEEESEPQVLEKAAEDVEMGMGGLRIQDGEGEGGGKGEGGKRGGKEGVGERENGKGRGVPGMEEKEGQGQGRGGAGEAGEGGKL
ncbi:hypothetical protein MMC30_000759 [Trapelia coarctata]|nr:hypothetical protein [Trapelia coarctata]